MKKTYLIICIINCINIFTNLNAFPKYKYDLDKISFLYELLLKNPSIKLNTKELKTNDYDFSDEELFDEPPSNSILEKLIKARTERVNNEKIFNLKKKSILFQNFTNKYSVQ